MKEIGWPRSVASARFSQTMALKTPARALRGRSWVRHHSGTQALLPVPPSCHAEHDVLHRAENIPSLLIPNISFLGCVASRIAFNKSELRIQPSLSIRVGKQHSFS